MAPVLADHTFDIITHSPKQTFQLGERLGRLLRACDVVCLQGDLGSGKTCLTQGIGAGLQVSGTINSPTFVFINEYPSAGQGPTLYHVDLYRVEDYSTAFSLGLDDYMYGDGVTVIEWAERALELMPSERLWIALNYVDYTKRSLLFAGTGQRYLDMVTTLKAELFGHKG